MVARLVSPTLAVAARFAKTAQTELIFVAAKKATLGILSEVVWVSENMTFSSSEAL